MEQNIRTGQLQASLIRKSVDRRYIAFSAALVILRPITRHWRNRRAKTDPTISSAYQPDKKGGQDIIRVPHHSACNSDKRGLWSPALATSIAKQMPTKASF
jgi:hypothetical protein